MKAVVVHQYGGPEVLKFEDYPDQPGPFGAPLLPFGVALLVCAHHSALDGGDHTILVGRVVHTELAGSDPLVYCNGTFASPVGAIWINRSASRIAGSFDKPSIVECATLSSCARMA